METIQTHRGKIIHLTRAIELWSAQERGDVYLRAYCHIHGGDHQRSLSIHKDTGWGHCFQCQALILVEDYNPTVAQDLRAKTNTIARAVPLRSTPFVSDRHKQCMTHRPQDTWKRDERAVLHSLSTQLSEALLNVDLGDVWQAQAYLHERRISLELVHSMNIGYLPRSLLEAPDVQPYHQLLSRWTERLLFPLRSPTGNGYIGRSLWHWQIGMDENIHKSLLEGCEDAPRRWLKTNPAGWFCTPPVDFAPCIIVVEGGFDRLALLEAGFAANEVIALAGTAAQADWFPPQVKGLVLALDADRGGLESTDRLIEQLTDFELMIFPPPDTEDHLGKDWNERWRRSGFAGIESLFTAFAHLKQVVHIH